MIKLATPLSVVHVPGEIPTLCATAAVCRVSISLLVSTRQSTYTAKSRVVEAGLKLPDRAFSALPARSLFSTWRPQHPRFRTFLLFHLSLFSLFSLSFFITCFDLLVNSNLVCTRRMQCPRMCALCTRACCNCVHHVYETNARPYRRRWTCGGFTKGKACLYIIR